MADSTRPATGKGASEGALEGPGAGSKLQIGALSLRIPGESRGEGVRIAERLPERLNELADSVPAGEIDSLSLQVRVRPGASPREIEDAIVATMRRRLQRQP